MKTRKEMTQCLALTDGDLHQPNPGRIVNGGGICVECGGFSGLIYTNECVALHDEYEKELWDELYEDAKDFGFDNVPAFMATWNRKDMLNDLDQMKNMIVWYFAEKIANEETNG